MELRMLLAVFFCAYFGLSSPCPAREQTFIPEKYKGIILHAPDIESPWGLGNPAFGQGIYRLVINQKTGAVDEVSVLRSSGTRKYDAAAVMAFFEWKFRPGAIKQIDIPVAFEKSVRIMLKKAGSK